MDPVIREAFLNINKKLENLESRLREVEIIQIGHEGKFAWCSKCGLTYMNGQLKINNRKECTACKGEIHGKL